MMNTPKLKLQKRQGFWERNELFGFFLLFLLIVSIYFTIVKLYGKSIEKYEGKVISISSWDGSAQLKTKSKVNGQDTIVNVTALKYESFEVGQTITVWTGGERFNKFTTQPPR